MAFQIQQARRIVAALGVVAAFAATFNVYVVPSTDWYRDAAIQGSIIVAATILMAGLGAELVGRFFRGALMQVFLLLVVLAAAGVPNLYLNSATFFGRDQADFQTWHLLPLFAVMYQVEAVVVVGVVAGVGCLLFLGIQRVRQRSPNNAFERARDG